MGEHGSQTVRDNLGGVSTEKKVLYIEDNEKNINFINVFRTEGFISLYAENDALGGLGMGGGYCRF